VDKRIESTPFSYPITNPTVKSQIIFSTTHDLESTVHRSDRMFFINMIALTGGAAFTLIFVIGLFFKLWVNWLMQLTIVRNLFSIDPSQAKKPKSAATMQKRDPRLLLQEARMVAKKRVSMTRSCCDRAVMVLEAVIGVIFCKATKFARILAQGKREVQADLNVYNLMERMRMLQGTINALTTFNQRRLLMHQVETSFLLKPYREDKESKDKKAKTEKSGASRKKKRILDSDDESSEEDFFFLEKALKESNELDEVDRRLLAGII